MFAASETGPEIGIGGVRFRINLPSIKRNKGYGVKVYVINKVNQFDPKVDAYQYDLHPVNLDPGQDDLWGDMVKCRWESETLTFEPGMYLYRFEITGPDKEDNRKQKRSLYFGDPCARETDAGIFSVFRMHAEMSFYWTDEKFQVPPLDEIILYELNVAEFARDFNGVIDRIPYLLSLGVNAIELMPINSIAEPNSWGYLPVFYFAPEERFGGPQGMKRLVNECHRAGIAVVLDMVYAHADRMFPYQIGYERFFHLWEDPCYTDSGGTHRSPNPLACKYINYGFKNDWRMDSTREFFAAVNAFWLKEYHVDGFRYDHVNGYLDRKPRLDEMEDKWGKYRPLFKSLQDLTKATYRISKDFKRFMSSPTGPSRIIQIAEDLHWSNYQLSPTSNSAVNGNWEKQLANRAGEMAISGRLSREFGPELLLSDGRFDAKGYNGWKKVDNDEIPALVVQFIECHDDNRLLYLVHNKSKPKQDGYDYHSGLDDQSWWKLRPFAIGLLTCVGIPMLWAGQEFGENTGLETEDTPVRVRGLRPLHWDYFYNVDATPGYEPVLPLVTLYRHLGGLRKQHQALRAPRENAKVECNEPDRDLLVYRRWKNNEVMIVALNFSDEDRNVDIPFGHTGRWVDILEAAYGHPPFEVNVIDPASHESTSIPSNFGRIFKLF